MRRFLETFLIHILRSKFNASIRTVYWSSTSITDKELHATCSPPPGKIYFLHDIPGGEEHDLWQVEEREARVFLETGEYPAWRVMREKGPMYFYAKGDALLYAQRRGLPKSSVGPVADQAREAEAEKLKAEIEVAKCAAEAKRAIDEVERLR